MWYRQKVRSDSDSLTTMSAMDVGVFLVDGTSDFGLAAILEVLRTANSLRKEIDWAPEPWNLIEIGMGRQARTGAGHLVPVTPLGQLRRPPGMLVVPGLDTKDPDEVVEHVTSSRNRPVLDMIAGAMADHVELAAACTGAFFLAEAGVLDGLTATTSWWLAARFRDRYPRVQLDEVRTVCRADGITTAGAVFAHVDLALRLVRLQSQGLADLVSRYLLIGSRPSQATFAVPVSLTLDDPRMAAFERWVRGHLGEPIQIATVAAELGLSHRTLQRLTAATVGMSPMDFVNEIRLDHATYLLRASALSVETVAHRVGYADVRTLRALIRRRRGMTIRELRYSID